MIRSFLVLPIALLFLASCDSKPAETKPDPAAEKAAAEKADKEARLAKRRADREAKEAADKQAAEDLVKKIDEVAVIPEGAKMPKKPSQACDQVAEAQAGFMKKFHPETEEAGLNTMLGLVKKQCNEMGDIKVAMCQKFALEATTEELKKSINEYLPVCMGKYKAS